MSRSTHVPCRTEAGFTLVEALVAMIVLSFGLIAVTNLMVVAASSNSVANQSTAAAAVASQEMERLKALRFSDPALDAGGSVTSDTTSYNSNTDFPGVGRIHARWLIQNVVVARTAPDQPAGLKFITVRAEGTGALTGARSRAEFTTFRTENPDPSAVP